MEKRYLKHSFVTFTLFAYGQRLHDRHATGLLYGTIAANRCEDRFATSVIANVIGRKCIR